MSISGGMLLFFFSSFPLLFMFNGIYMYVWIYG